MTISTSEFVQHFALVAWLSCGALITIAVCLVTLAARRTPGVPRRLKLEVEISAKDPRTPSAGTAKAAAIDYTSVSWLTLLIDFARLMAPLPPADVTQLKKALADLEALEKKG